MFNVNTFDEFNEVIASELLDLRATHRLHKRVLLSNDFLDLVISQILYLAFAENLGTLSLQLLSLLFCIWFNCIDLFGRVLLLHNRQKLFPLRLGPPDKLALFFNDGVNSLTHFPRIIPNRGNQRLNLPATSRRHTVD